ncbi:MFS transporter [Cognatishimia sp. SS12]|uniref:MFS transporter n=1 Tax=Cognatishimia sp. SS12 TaxID=2979465 RepID=UPI00232CF9BF|nr:MFS transporter [Cognatishimia sp. SS12]MDC0738914.1 MFS transporter [Cognatishimia sp. SS12]
MTARLKTKWHALIWTGLAVILSLTTWFSATAVIPNLSADWGLSAAQSSWLTNAVQAGFVIGALTASLLALVDVVPLTRLMAAAALTAALANAVLLLSPSFAWVVLARFLTGVALSSVYPPAMKFIATWFKTGRGLAMGAMVGALSLGSALPHLVRGLGGSVDWQPVVLVTSLCSLLAAVIFGTILHDGPHGFAKTRVDPRQVGAILRDRPVMLANLGYFGHMWELYAMWGWFLTFATAGFASEISAAHLSILTFAVIALGAPGSFLAGMAADRIGRCNVTAVLMAVSGASALAIGFSFDAPLWVFAMVAMLWGATVVSDSAQFSAAVTELADQTLVGSALAFQMGVGFAITILTIWLVPQIAEFFGGWQWSLLVLVPGPCIGVAAMLVLKRHPAAIKIANGKR